MGRNIMGEKIIGRNIMSKDNNGRKYYGKVYCK